MTQHSDLLMVEIDEDPAALLSLLVAAELDVRVEGRALLVRLGAEKAEETYDLIRDAVADLDLSLHRLERHRHQVADLFRDLPAVEASYA
ncbi:hypothetical protein [Actinophytocola sp.]|uniref:hypothetical protein n=1 Tax=Actinophytocola sp. TaxID=1872138 RepID=UPI0025C11B49|nr:hypothetical protein [Actinophytocola sp.]